jgi:leader peptidase (prepilin peptidase) / N-methyltransferase
MQHLAALAATFVAGVLAGAAVNWAVYALAWNRRLISPWSPAHDAAPPRRPGDRTPIWGWLGLRREESLHGRGFWVRPLAVELLMGVSWAALWWWEVARQGLVADQIAALAGGAVPPGVIAAPAWITYATFASHALLVALMAAASLIDIDEKTIPEEITDYGTLAGLALATLMPMGLLPQAVVRSQAPMVGVAAQLPAGVAFQKGGALYLEPVTVIAPEELPAALGGGPQWLGLALGLACYAIWCFALAPGIWRRRRGLVFGFRLLVARAAREMARPRRLALIVAGAAAIVGVWAWGGARWAGLLTALVGMIGACAMVWAMRIVGTVALRREALGFGDVTLMMMVGSFLGWQAGVIIFFLAPFAGLVIGLLQLVLRRNDEIFYGPFLCLATLVVMLRWATFWNADTPLQQVFAEPWLVVAMLAAGVVLLGAMLVIWRNIKEAVFGVRKESGGA